MRRLLFWLGWELAGAVCLAQVRVEVTLDQQQFMSKESLVAVVHITNLSGQQLQLGNTPDWLRFSIESRDGSVVAKWGDPPVRGEFTLESSQVATKRVELAPYFDLSTPRSYWLAATVRVPRWDQAFPSPPCRFTIVRGTKFWEQEFGVPNSPGQPEGRPEMRKYILSEATYSTQFKLYVRVTDLEETRVFRVTPVAPLVSFSHPEAQVDRSSNLHVLHQTGAHAFSYCVLNPDGDIVLRQIYEYRDTRPTLRVGPEGKILVTGGARRVTRADIPPPDASTSSTNSLPTRP